MLCKKCGKEHPYGVGPITGTCIECKGTDDWDKIDQKDAELQPLYHNKEKSKMKDFTTQTKKE